MEWFAQRTICYATREREATEALYAQLHKDAPYHDGTEESWAKDRSPDHPFHYSDGVTIWIADEDVNPDDRFLTPPGVDTGG
ncbi:hypothetical protein [Nocardioides sp. ChNu-99]|uniref:hypothetical protein n=1 Tax=Nocardioides sp. ChNu-99 TaxID=2839897 RepID=UPI002406B7FF|nr:hypothetical protein [Nocardioides sp. ChNu-99]MDF9716032.1 hypothetical protein [Nocardioides sp. ChNu-99]